MAPVPATSASSSGPILRLSSTAPARTQTSTGSDTDRTPSPPLRIPDGTLRLRGGPISDRRVTWGEDVIDNEGLGRKKSKVCCIFHRAREFGESSDESSSDSSSDESDNDDGRARPVGGSKGSCGNSNHNHGQGRRPKRPPSPNAYEKMPKPPRKNE